MERIKNLDRYQKGILLLLIAMLVIFTVIYFITSSRVGFEYMGSILCPSNDNGNTVYSGVIQGEQAAFTVTADKTVTFTYGDKFYGPFTAEEDPTAVPDDKEFMVGVEIREGKDIFFRGGVFRSGEDLILFDEDGGFESLSITAVMSDGTVVDSEGNVVDHMAPSASTILHLMAGPQLTSKGEWTAWFLGLFLSAATAVSILFADELFRWNLAFQIRDVDRAEPSDWELAGRYIGWTILPIMALVIYVIGLK
ncbi:MAG: hypothetical protein IJ001_10180 [Oscillospiraceae bacterium]|nr:hypothetical protein [Oscillospiraceae bacterium]